MSYAKEVKDELTKIQSEHCCQMAELSALLWINSEISLSSDGLRLDFQTTNPTISKRLVVLLKSLYDVELELLSKKRERLNRVSLYIVRVVKGAERIIIEHNLLAYDSKRHNHITNDCCKAAFMRGAFLSSGSLNDPNHSYHLEISCNDEHEIVFLQHLMNEHDLNAKIAKRRNTLIVYIKEAARIADFLNIIGAVRMYFQYEDVIIKRDISNSINRVINCEVANEQKTVQSATNQINEITYIKKIISEDKLDNKMAETMDLRIENPTSSLNELVEIAKEKGINLTKSGLNHRFRKIHELYEILMENKQVNHD